MSKTNISPYISLVKFSHTLFAMPFAIAGFAMGVYLTDAQLNWNIFLLVILCMVFARNAAMGFNRYIDRAIDAKNPRTAIREIPKGIIKAHSALIFVIINSGLFVLATWFINSLTFYLSPVALIVILGYSYTKKFTSLCHLVLGLGLALAPIGAYLAVTGAFAVTPILLSLVVLFWVGGFDIIYALQDEIFDKKEMLYSIPASWGRKKALWISTILHFIAFTILISIGLKENFSFVYWSGATIFSVMLWYQHWIVKPTDISKINKAFFTVNSIAGIIISAFIVLELIVS